MMCTAVRLRSRRECVANRCRWAVPGILDGQSGVKPGDAGVYGLVLGWGFAAIRLVAGLVMVLLLRRWCKNGCVKHRKRRHRSN